MYKMYYTRCLDIQYCKLCMYARVKDGSHKSPLDSRPDILDGLRGVHTVTQKGFVYGRL